MSTPDRHQQLLDAGWIYESRHNYYRKAGSSDDGTAQYFNQDAAYQQYLADQLDSASTPEKATKPSATRQADPRRKEPE